MVINEATFCWDAEKETQAQFLRFLSRVFSSTTVQKHQFFSAQLSSQSNSGKTIALTRQTFVGKVMSLLLNMLSRLVITFLPRSKRLLISWLQSPSAVILESLLTEPLGKSWSPYLNSNFQERFNQSSLGYLNNPDPVIYGLQWEWIVNGL